MEISRPESPLTNASITQTPHSSKSYLTHLNNAVWTLFITILCAAAFFLEKDRLLSMGIFFPLTTICLIKTCLEAQVAYRAYRKKE